MNKNLRQDINFFEALGKDKVASSVDFMQTVKKCVIIWLAVSVVVVGIAALSNVMLKAKINNLTAENEKLAPQLEEVNALKLEAEILKADIEKFNTAVADFDVNPRLTVADISNIAYAKPNGINITAISYGDNRVSVTCNGATELLTADYANNLRNSVTKNPNATADGTMYINNFKNVTYTGATGGEGVYTSTIIIDLNDRGEVVNE